jgi:hypothetical protein
MSLILQNSISEDQDIMKSSSVATLLITMLKSAFRDDRAYDELIANLIRVMGLLCKATFNKTIGVEPILIKGFLNTLPEFLKLFDSRDGPESEKIVFNTVKTVGIFFSLAALQPNKLSALYNTIIDIQLLHEVVSLINNAPSDISCEAL